MNLRNEVEFYRTNKLRLGRDIFLSILILGFFLIGFWAATYFSNQIDTSLKNASATITPRYWYIQKVTPDKNNKFTLAVQSSIGNVRNYENIISYGLSQSGRYLALHNIEGIYIIDLEDESRKTVAAPVDKFFGDIGEVFSWNNDDEYFALPVVVQSPKQHTEVWIYKKDGTLYSTITADIPVSESGKSIVEPVYFSKKDNILLIRTYKTDDLSFVQDSSKKYSLYDLPIYLDTYNLEGKMIEEFNVRDYDTTGTNIIYFWNQTADYIEYYIYKNTPPDITKDYLFTKQVADNGR